MKHIKHMKYGNINLKKQLLFLISLSLLISLFSGCAKKTENILSENNLNTPNENQGGAPMRNMKIGKVTKVDGNTVEILTAKMPERGEMQGGRERPQGERPQGERAQQGERVQGERVRRDPDAPPQEGRPQGGNGVFMRNMEFTDEKIEIVIPEDVKIMSRDSEVVSELKPDDIISYSDSDGKISSVRLMEIPTE